MLATPLLTVVLGRAPEPKYAAAVLRAANALGGRQLAQSAWGAGAEMSPGVGVHVGGLAMSNPPNLCLQTMTRLC